MAITATRTEAKFTNYPMDGQKQVFIRRRLVSLEHAKLTDAYVDADADAMLACLERKLANARVLSS